MKIEPAPPIQADWEYVSDYEKFAEQMKLAFIEAGIPQGFEDIFEAGFRQGFEEGFRKGFEEGIEKAKVQVTIAAIGMGFDDDTITELTGLSVAQIQDLRDHK
jgi:predicted transposase/invertase (TIGR01784 family)